MNNAACGEVRALNCRHYFFDRYVRFFQEHDKSINNLSEVMGWDVCGHADRDARSAVDYKVWYLGWEHLGLLGSLIKVGQKVHCFLIYIGKHLLCDLCQSCLCIPVCCCRVAVY